NFPSIDGFKPNGFAGCLLPLDACKEIGKSLPKKSTLPVLLNAAITTHDEKIHVAVTDLDNPKLFSPRAVTGQFPNWEAVMPKRPASHTITVNADYLMRIAKFAAGFADNRTKPVRIQFFGADNAMRFDATNPETAQGFTAILMPLRSGSDLP